MARKKTTAERLREAVGKLLVAQAKAAEDGLIAELEPKEQKMLASAVNSYATAYKTLSNQTQEELIADLEAAADQLDVQRDAAKDLETYGDHFEMGSQGDASQVH